MKLLTVLFLLAAAAPSQTAPLEAKAYILAPDNPTVVKSGLKNSKPILIVLTHWDKPAYKINVTVRGNGTDFTFALQQQHTLESGTLRYWAYGTIELSTMQDPAPASWTTALLITSIRVYPDAETTELKPALIP